MKRKITSLLILLVMVGFNVSAIVGPTGFQGEGVYTFKSVQTSEYMTSNGSSVSTPEPTITSAAKWLVVKNTVDDTKYNIITQDKQYVVSLKYIKAYETADNFQNAVEALMIFPETASGSGEYYIQSQLAGTDTYAGKFKGVNCPNDAAIGDGFVPSGLAKYKWVLDKVSDLPTPAPVVSVTAPEANANLLPGSSVTLKASVTPEEGATISAVVFLIDGVEELTNATDADADGIYEYTWTAPAAVGPYSIAAKATSSVAAITTSDAVSVVVATLPATAIMTWPSAATTILPNKQVTLEADATPATGNTITKVEFFDGATLLGEDTSAPFTFNVSFSTIGTFSITAKVTDSGSSTVTSAAVSLETSLTTTIKSLYVNFEGAYDAGDWTWKSTKYAAAGLSHVAYDVEKARSAANGVLEIDFSTAVADGADNMHYMVNGLDALPSAGNVYITIHYADDNSAEGPLTGPTLWSSVLTPTPGTAAANDDGTFKSKSWAKPASDMGADGSSVTIYPAVRFDANNTAGKVYVDDIMMFYDPQASGYDATAPTAVTSLAAPTVSSNQIVLTWNEGMDVGIGIDSTYILRTTTADAAPALTAMVGYSTKGLPAGLDMVGSWTVVGTVPLGTATFTDNTVVDGGSTTYTYAVLHKDYAYNYATAATVTNGVVTQLNKVQVNSFNCYGVKGAIELGALPQGEQLAIFGISGAKVSAQAITSSELTVDLSAGIYLVRVAGNVQKVVVK